MGFRRSSFHEQLGILRGRHAGSEFIKLAVDGGAGKEKGTLYFNDVPTVFPCSSFKERLPFLFPRGSSRKREPINAGRAKTTSTTGPRYQQSRTADLTVHLTRYRGRTDSVLRGDDPKHTSKWTPSSHRR